MRRSPLLTVDVIVKNGLTAGSNVVRAIESVLPLTPDMQMDVLDTGSHDGTQDAIRRLWATRKNVRLLDGYRWRNDFADARNWALRKASGRWVMWIDADDELKPTFLPAIQALLRGPDNAAYLFHHVGPRMSGDVPQLRLWPNIPEAHWKWKLHEQIAPSLTQAGIPIRNTFIEVYHYGFGDKEHLQESAERNRSIIVGDAIRRVLR